ncbi:hypothetical protein [Geobacillus sp. Geo 8.1]
MSHWLSEVENKIRVLEQEIKAVKQVINDIKGAVNQEKHMEEDVQAIAYFTYSLLLPRTAGAGQKGTVVGNFVIRNIGSVPLENPFICLKIIPKEQAVLSAKLGEDVQYDHRLNPLIMESWTYMMEQGEQIVEEKGEFWLKPIRVSRIEPKQRLAFSNFQFTFAAREHPTSYKVKVEGFFFCQQLPNGIRSLNNIVIHV